MIRIVELFSGIGSQAKAFSRLGEEYEVLNTCEWDFHSILAYERIHGNAELLPEVAVMEKEELLKELSKFTLSSDGKKPLTPITLRGISVEGLRAILSAIRKTGNFVRGENRKNEKMGGTGGDTCLIFHTYKDAGVLGGVCGG